MQRQNRLKQRLLWRRAQLGFSVTRRSHNDHGQGHRGWPQRAWQNTRVCREAHAVGDVKFRPCILLYSMMSVCNLRRTRHSCVYWPNRTQFSVLRYRYLQQPRGEHLSSGG